MFTMHIDWLRVLLVVFIALLLFGSFFPGLIESFAEPDRCRFVATKMRYTTDSKGDDIQSLFRSNDGTRRSSSMNRKQCQAKCGSMQGCKGYTIPRDGECVLYEEGKLSEDPPDTISEPVPFYECRDSAPPKYLEQRDNRIDISCRPTTSTKPCKTCSYLGSPGCSEGSCLPPFTSESNIKLSPCAQWEELLSRFPDAVDTTKGGLVDKDTFLETTCGKVKTQPAVPCNTSTDLGGRECEHGSVHGGNCSTYKGQYADGDHICANDQPWDVDPTEFRCKKGAPCQNNAQLKVPEPAVPEPAVPETGSLQCKGAGAHAGVDGMDKWCMANCNHNPPYCPETHCKCT